MGDLFNKRMDYLLKNGSVGSSMVDDVNIIENKTFKNDINYRKGMIYDCEMNEIEEVDFKFEKAKTFSAEGYEVEYYVRFRPDFNIETQYKDRFYKNDGRDRLGFYIDVYDYSKKLNEKWLIVGKDDRVAFDRYNVMKCNWCLEWIANGIYKRCLGVNRVASDNTVDTPTSNTLGGSTINGDLTFYIPTSETTDTIELGTRFMISDSINKPRVFEVVNVVDTAPLGVTKLYMEQRLFNAHRDYHGVINDDNSFDFVMDLPIEDLPDGFGGKYHMICDCIHSSLPDISVDVPDEVKILGAPKYLYINGETVSLGLSQEDADESYWHIFVDNIEYTKDELVDYFEITIDKNIFSIQAINKVMAKYIVKVAYYDENKTFFDSVEMEVKI